MLIEFSVGNYASFKDTVTLSMVAAKLNSRDRSIDENNKIFIDKNLSLLSSTAIYGANASGKSNLVSAMSFMRRFVIGSSKETQFSESINIKPFLLSPETSREPSFFEMVFIIEGKRYRYGFEVTQEEVISEWLFFVPSTKEAKLFVREVDKINLGDRFKEGKGLEEKTRTNALFLSVVAQFNGAISKKVLGWFKLLGIISGLDDNAYRHYTINQLMKEGSLKEDIIRLVSELDLSINDIIVRKYDAEELKITIPEELRDLILKPNQGFFSVLTEHTIWDSNGRKTGIQSLDLATQESAGTEKLVFLAGPILNTLSEGRVLVIDEMEARLHPLITQKLIKLFNTIETNPKRAQLIFTTHDTNLLSNKIFRRDQIWFIEKDRYGSSHLYSLAEIKVRNDASFESDYIQGRYGAIPYLGNIEEIIVCDGEKEESVS